MRITNFGFFIRCVFYRGNLKPPTLISWRWLAGSMVFASHFDIGFSELITYFGNRFWVQKCTNIRRLQVFIHTARSSSLVLELHFQYKIGCVCLGFIHIFSFLIHIRENILYFSIHVIPFRTHWSVVVQNDGFTMVEKALPLFNY